MSNIFSSFIVSFVLFKESCINISNNVYRNVDFKKSSYLNGNLQFDMQHNKKHSEAEVDFRYGNNKKDFNKRIYLQTIMNHFTISKIKKTQYDINSKAVIPVLVCH